MRGRIGIGEFMHIKVTARDGSVSAGTLTYAEYRLFRTLARHSRTIQRVWVIVGPSDPPGGGVTCEVQVGLQASGSARVLAHGGHAHAAIDSAAERIGDTIERLAASNVDSV